MKQLDAKIQREPGSLPRIERRGMAAMVSSSTAPGAGVCCVSPLSAGVLTVDMAPTFPWGEGEVHERAGSCGRGKRGRVVLVSVVVVCLYRGRWLASDHSGTRWW
jgi:hypothetical protein